MSTECSRRRRRPETGVLYRAVQEELMSFLEVDERLPVYVARALRDAPNPIGNFTLSLGRRRYDGVRSRLGSGAADIA